MRMSRATLETWIPQSRLGPNEVAQGVSLEVVLSKTLKVVIAKKQSMDERPCLVLPQDFYD